MAAVSPTSMGEKQGRLAVYGREARKTCEVGSGSHPLQSLLVRRLWSTATMAHYTTGWGAMAATNNPTPTAAPPRRLGCGILFCQCHA